MLLRDFNGQIDGIYKTMPPSFQVCLFSALALESLHLTAKFMRDAVRIHVKGDELTLEGIGSGDALQNACATHQAGQLVFLSETSG